MIHDSNVEYASQSVKTQTIKDPIIEKLAAKIKKGTNSDNDDKKYEDEADEWNTIHINDYQNWLCENTTTGESTSGIQITHSLEAFTESLK
ncbi:10104_t:CDS:2 [Rhizophagus irregularis]|nr:10104_t:CDS:2 [Rhizophagus irregularis]